MLKKLIVAVLACLTLFLSQRALTESRGRSMPDRQANIVESSRASETETDSMQHAAPAATVDQTAVLF